MLSITASDIEMDGTYMRWLANLNESCDASISLRYFLTLTLYSSQCLSIALELYVI